VCVLSATLLCACAAEVRQRGPALGPAYPDAPEAKPLPISTALAPETASPDDAGAAQNHSGHQHGQAEDTRSSPDATAPDYTCPMHPEVSQPGPGRCPKCGMALEPRKPQAEPKPSAEPDLRPHEHHGEHGAPR
jgi:hypothetical protein